MKALPLLLSLLLLSMSFVSAQQQKEVSVAEAEDYRDIGITEKGFEVKDPYALPVYEPRSTSLLPFHEQISSLLNSYLGGLLSTFDLKEAFALRILFEDIEPLLSFLGDLISIALTCIALPFLSFVRLLKAPLDILQFLITALLDPVISIPAHEIAIIESFASALKDLFYTPSKLLKPVEFLVYTPDPLAALASISFSGSLRSFLSPFSAIASTISRAIDFIPFLNIAKGFFTVYLILLFRSLMDIPLSLVTYLLSPYREVFNVLLLPISLSFIALDSLFSPMRSLLSFLLLPILFLLRIPLTPPLILFNFFSHSLQGFGQFLRSFSNPAAILLTSLTTLIPLPSVCSPILSVLFVSPAAPVLLFGSIAIGVILLLGVLALLIPALAFVLLFFTGILLSAIAGALVLLSALSFTGLIAGAVLALILICLIVSGYTPAAVMLGVATYGAAIPPETIALIILCLGVFVLGVAGGALSGLILGVALIPLAALITGTLGAAILLPLLLLSGFLMLTVLLLVPLIALTSVILPVLSLSALLLAVALLALTGSLLVALPLLLAILFLLTPMGLLALLSILSPELFRVVFPPEAVEIAKRIALLPKDVAIVINGLLYLPVDTMRAIAVLDAPAEVEDEAEVITGEVIPYGAQQEMIIEKNETATEELPEGGVPQDGTVTEEPAPQPTKEQEVYGPPESLKTPQEPTEPPEEPPAPTENISRALEGLEEIPKYESLEDVYEEGEKYFQNATTGLMGLSDELDVLKYGMDRIKELDQMEVDIRENLVYTDFLQGYGKTGRNFEEDLKNYSAQRLELDKKYQRYMADNSLNETESRDLWNDVWRLEEMNRDIKTHIEGGWNQTMINIKAAGIHNVTIFNPRNTETIKKLFGSDGPQFHPAEGPEEGIIDNLYANLKDDHDILSQARQEIENRQRELGVRQ